MAGLLRKNLRNFSPMLFLSPEAVKVMAETEAAAPDADVGLVGDGFSSNSSSFEPNIFIFKDLVLPTLLAFLEAGSCKVLLCVSDDLRDLGLVFRFSMIF